LLYLSLIRFLKGLSVPPTWLAMRSEQGGARGRLSAQSPHGEPYPRAALGSLLGDGHHYDLVPTVYRLLSAAQCPEGIARLLLD
jgi:hypothetical protein